MWYARLDYDFDAPSGATRRYIAPLKKKEEGIGVAMTTINMEGMMELTSGEITAS